MRKDLDSLIEQALANINNDRQETEILLGELKEYMDVSLTRDTQILEILQLNL